MIDRASLWNMLLSAGDPELREIAERIAEGVSALIPKDSPLRSRLAERIFGVLKAAIETRSKGKSPIVEASTEKFVDVLDYISAIVFGQTDAATNGSTRSI